MRLVHDECLTVLSEKVHVTGPINSHLLTVPGFTNFPYAVITTFSHPSTPVPSCEMYSLGLFLIAMMPSPMSISPEPRNVARESLGSVLPEVNVRVAAQSATQSPSAAEAAASRDMVSRDLNVGSSMVNDLWGHASSTKEAIVGADFDLVISGLE